MGGQAVECFASALLLLDALAPGETDGATGLGRSVGFVLLGGALVIVHGPKVSAVASQGIGLTG